MKKSILALLLAVLMVASLLPATAMADGTIFEVSTQEALENVLARAQDGDTVRLVDDIAIVVTDTGADELASMLYIRSNITLDLNEHKLSYDQTNLGVSLACSPCLISIVGADVIITGNGTIDAEAQNNNAYGINIIDNGSLTVENGNFYGAMTAIQVEQGTLNIYGGTFQLAKTIAELAPGYAKYIINAIDHKYKAGDAAIAITGGTFIGFNPSANPEGTGTSYVVGDCEVTGTGEFVISAPTAQTDNHVAEVNGMYFTSLNNAIAAANRGATVKLLKDVTENVVVPKLSDVIINLNGFNITNSGNEDTITVKYGAKLEVIGSGTVDNTVHAKAAVWNEGTTTLSGGTYTRSNENGSDSGSGGNSYYNIVNHGSMVINAGAVVKQSGGFSSMIENGYYSYASTSSRNGYVAGTNSANPDLTINGGYFEGGLNAVKNDDGGVLVINEGVFSNVTQSAVMNWNKATIYDGTYTVIGDGNSVLVNGYLGANDLGELIVYGGEFTCPGDLIDYGQDATQGGTVVIEGGVFNFGGNFLTHATANGTVKGGSFNHSVADYVDDTLNFEVNNSGTYTYYTDFATALANALPGAQIKDLNAEPSAAMYSLVVDPANGGQVLRISVSSGTQYTLYTPGKSGYAFLGWSGSDGKTYAGTDTVTVTSDITLTASWVRHPDTEYVPEPEEPEEPEVPAFPFYDVPTSAWYYTAVKYVYDNKLMDGVDTYVFAPNDTLTRAMVWTIIARMSGVDTTGGNTWYAKAQEWVITNGISDGENPTAAITRQELVTMLYRYAQIKGYDVSVGESTNILSYVDATSISEYAMSAFQWACGSGLTEGDENGALTPLATATRAQAAAMIMRFLSK